MSKFGKVVFHSDDDLRAYYGEFYPTEEWATSLRPMPREARDNPQFMHLVDALTDAEIGALREDMAPYLKVRAQDLVGMAPLRNRIAGNARVMPSTRTAMCPSGDGGRLVWRPDDPDRMWCPNGHAVDPFALFPQTGAIEIVGPKGDQQAYPYHDAPDGRRIYLNGEFMDSLRVYYLIEACRSLGMLYQATGDIRCAERAAAIVYGFARAVPHWPKIHRGRPGVAEEDRFRPVTDYPVYAGIWYDKYHTGIRHVSGLAEAYDFVANAPVWGTLDRLAEGGDARAVVEEELFRYSAVDEIRYDIHYPHPDAALSNYIPYQATGMILFGRGVGMPELVHYAYWKLGQLAEKTVMPDAVFPESMSYGAMHLHGMARAAEKGEGYSDPPGFVSGIDGRRFDRLDNAQELPVLRRAVETLASMVYPDGNYIQAHDTHHSMRRRRGAAAEEARPPNPAPDETRPQIYPAFGHAFLGAGERRRDNRIQAHLHYSGNWGHDHDDMLNFVLWACGEELISDIGYQLTYRGFCSGTSGHNLVVVDRHTQQPVQLPGGLMGWHPAGDVQVAEVSAPEVYPQCRTYRRTLFLAPVGEQDHVVVDIFDVAGGRIHEWMAQGNCMNDQTLEVSVPTAYHADSYADGGKPFTPPAHREWEDELHAQGLKPRDVNPWYGVFRDVHKGRMTGPFTAMFRSVDRDLPDVRFHMVAPADGDLYTCTVPSLRKCWRNELQEEDHSLVEKFRMPKLVVRREGEDLCSRFVAVWEPMRGRDVVSGVRDLAPGKADVTALAIRATGDETVRVFYSTDAKIRHLIDDHTTFQGRYAAVRSNANGCCVSLYDCVYFRDADLEVTVSERPALPVVGVRKLADGTLAVALDGAWTDVSEGEPLTFGEPELAVLSQDGCSHRAFPVERVTTNGGETLLHCTRHPGVEYDRESETLWEILTPFQTVKGRAEVRLPSRVWLRSKADQPGDWEVRTTDAIAVGNRHIGRTGVWVTV